MNKRSKSVKKFSTIGLLLMVIVTMLFSVALASGTATISISGAGVNKAVEFTTDELLAMKDSAVQAVYSSQNNWPTPKLTAAEGVSLMSLLKVAGLKDEATLIKVSGADGYYKIFTVKELLKDERYTFPQILQATEKGKTAVVPMIALKTGDGSKQPLALSDTAPLFLMGQRTINEQNNPWFVKGVAKIEVLTTKLEQVAAPIVSIAAGTVKQGTELTLGHQAFDAVKIYYTDNGTTPDLNSKMFNLSATYWQPQLNLPITINKDTTIKAFAVGVGKMDSEVVTFTYKIDSAATPVFSDLESYAWAKPAILDLAGKGIINGIGDNKFAPQNNLTRAEFAKIMVLATGNQPLSNEKSSFTDVQSSMWYAGYVGKAVELGFLKGVGNNQFAPNEVLTQEQMIAVVVRAVDKDKAAEKLNGSGLKNFVGVDTISAWAQGYVEFAEQKALLEHGHLITVMKDGKYNFDGQQAASRGITAETVARMLKVQ